MQCNYRTVVDFIISGSHDTLCRLAHTLANVCQFVCQKRHKLTKFVTGLSETETSRT